MASSEIPTDNPAGRLHTFLLEATRVPKNDPARKGWAKVLGVSLSNPDDPQPEEEDLLIERLVQFRALIDDTERKLREIDGIPERYFRPFPRIRQVSLTNLTVQFGNYSSQISDGDLTVLEFCAEKLSDHKPEPIVAEEQLRDLLVDVDALFDEVSASILPAELKAFVLHQLETIRRAIQEYRIRGIERLREALSMILGSTIVNAELVKNASLADEISSFSKILTTFASMVTFASKATPLIGPISKVIGFLLPAGVDIPPVDNP